MRWIVGVLLFVSSCAGPGSSPAVTLADYVAKQSGLPMERGLIACAAGGHVN